MELPAALQRVKKVPVAQAGWIHDYYEANKAFETYEENAKAAAHAAQMAKKAHGTTDKEPTPFELNFDSEVKRLTRITGRVGTLRERPKNASRNPLDPATIPKTTNPLDPAEDWRLRPLRSTDVVMRSLQPQVLAAMKDAFHAETRSKQHIDVLQFYAFNEKYEFETNRGSSDRLFALWDSQNVGLLSFENFAMAVGPKWTALQYDWKLTGGILGDQPRKVGGIPKGGGTDRLDFEGGASLF
jgi:hypothetical protein